LEEKTTAIEEANDLLAQTLDNLIRNLMVYEVQLQEKKREEPPKKEVLTFNASSETMKKMTLQ